MKNAPALPANVAAAFDAFTVEGRNVLLDVRALIFQTAASNPTIGPLTETLKWGQPAYLTDVSKSGSTLRLGEKDGHGVVYLNCKTTLVDSLRDIYPDAFTYEGTRAVKFPLDQPLPNNAPNNSPNNPLAHCIEMTLTYHLTKR